MMLVRVVRMEFEPAKVQDFLSLFEERRNTISKQAGCSHLELLQDASKENIYYTLSHWKCEEDLNNYRESDFFKETWEQTKRLFSNKPSAYSLLKMDQ